MKIFKVLLLCLLLCTLVGCGSSESVDVAQVMEDAASTRDATIESAKADGLLGKIAQAIPFTQAHKTYKATVDQANETYNTTVNAAQLKDNMSDPFKAMGSIGAVFSGMGSVVKWIVVALVVILVLFFILKLLRKLHHPVRAVAAAPTPAAPAVVTPPPAGGSSLKARYNTQ